MSNKKKIAFYTLGCKVNQYETLKLSEEFTKRGFEVTDQASFADVYVINSCTVTGMADKKSRNFARRSKRINPNAITALIGCYAEIARDSLYEIPEIDIVLGSMEKENFPDVLQRYCDEKMPSTVDDAKSLLEEETNEVKETIPISDEVSLLPDDALKHITESVPENNEKPRLQSMSRAYLKIEDGCDRYCSYCVIPYARGPVRSRQPEDILDEVKSLVSAGYKEIILTGINTALYGKDLPLNDLPFYNKTTVSEGIVSFSSNSESKRKIGDGIIDIVNRIAAIDCDFRIRLSSLEPTVVDAECVKELIKCEKLCSHLHLSLQSGSDKILSDMKRRYSMDEYLKIIDVLRKKDPNYAVSTDIIVGFPGETDEDFNESMNAIRRIGFSKIHVFKYSKRPATIAADMSNQVSEDVKNDRSKLLIEEGNISSKNFLNQNIGQTRNVLFFNSINESNYYRGLSDNGIEINYYSESDITNCMKDITLESNMFVSNADD